MKKINPRRNYQIHLLRKFYPRKQQKQQKQQTANVLVIWKVER